MEGFIHDLMWQSLRVDELSDQKLTYTVVVVLSEPTTKLTLCYCVAVLVIGGYLMMQLVFLCGEISYCGFHVFGQASDDCKSQIHL